MPAYTAATAAESRPQPTFHLPGGIQSPGSPGNALLNDQFLQLVKNYFRKFRNVLGLLPAAGREFMTTNSWDKGAALSYYTIFALPPILIIVITAAGAIFGEQVVSGKIYAELSEVVGPEGAKDVQKIVKSVQEPGKSIWATLAGLATFIIASTGVFISMQDSLNSIWCLKPKPRSQISKLLLDRVLSFGMILAITFLLLISMVVSALLVALSRYIEYVSSRATVFYLQGVHLFVSIGIITLLFACIYKFLPDARIRWRDVWIGSLVTALLFTLGKALIGLYLGSSNPGTVYGAAGTVVLLLVWVFYSSQILFFGSVFTLVYARKYGADIYPATYAVRIKNEEVELGQIPVNAECDDKMVEEARKRTLLRKRIMKRAEHAKKLRINN